VDCAQSSYTARESIIFISRIAALKERQIGLVVMYIHVMEKVWDASLFGWRYWHQILQEMSTGSKKVMNLDFSKHACYNGSRDVTRLE